MWFISKKIDVSELREQLTKLEKRLSTVESDLINVLAQQKMIRDKVLRRFRGDLSAESQEETETVKSFNPFKS